MGDKPVDDSTSWSIYYLSFIANFPHFLSSYHLLYYDFRNKLFSDYRYWVAALVAPLVIILSLVIGIVQADLIILGALVNAMYFIVGWHYIKQVFGVISVCNAQVKIKLLKSERIGLKVFLYSIWAVSWLSFNINGTKSELEGIPFSSLNLSPVFLNLAYVFLTVAGGVCLWLAYKKYLREGQVIATAGWISILSLLLWYLPTLYNPTFFLLVPFFHSLQYLYFVFLLKSKQAKSLYSIRNDPLTRKAYFFKLYGFILLTLITGCTFMWFLPRFLDENLSIAMNIPNAKPYMFAFTILINLHHYFIDHAIWRHNNPLMQKYLFTP